MEDMREIAREGLETGVRRAERHDLERVSRLLGDTYEIVALIGSGGMGNVYFGRSNDNPSIEVAIKVLHPEFVNDEVLCARFLREAELLQKVRHPGIVAFYDASTDKGIAYYVMECVTGVTLEDYIKKGNFPLEKIPDLIIKVCEALHAVHSVGIIHRDLKPANIMVTEDFDVKLTDFGIARPENSQLTHHNEIVGSVCYIAPEIWIGEEPTPSLDLYSLGIVMYELLTGQVPFDGSSPGELMRKHLQSVPIPPNDINPSVPSYLNRITLSLLSKSKIDRPKDALVVVERIKKAIGSLTSSHTFSGYKQDTEEFLRVLDSEADENRNFVQHQPVFKTKKSHSEPSILKENTSLVSNNEFISNENEEKELSNTVSVEILDALSSNEKLGIIVLLVLMVLASGAIALLLW